MADPQERVHRVLEEGLERIETPRAAHAVLSRVERLTAGQTEEERGEQSVAARDGAGAAATTVEQTAAHSATPEHAVADTLITVAADSVAPAPAAEPIVAAAQTSLTPSQPLPPRARRGRNLLKQAALRRMGPLDAVDAQIYLAINEAPHPKALDSLAWIIALITTGGWIWVGGTLIAYLIHVPKSWLAVTRLLPSLTVSTWLIEYPVKTFFRRRRPFVRIVQALVIGKRPGSWSFPSGHTGASFASAWMLSSVWPRQAPIFFSLAGMVGFSRIYVGAHYPGDVISGAVLGVTFSEMVRRVVARFRN